MQANEQFTLQGYLVVLLDEWDNSDWTDQEREMVRNMQLRKIDLAQEVVILGEEGSGSSMTHAFVDYAKQTGKPFRYWKN